MPLPKQAGQRTERESRESFLVLAGSRRTSASVSLSISDSTRPPCGFAIASEASGSGTSEREWSSEFTTHISPRKTLRSNPIPGPRRTALLRRALPPQRFFFLDWLFFRCRSRSSSKTALSCNQSFGALRSHDLSAISSSTAIFTCKPLLGQLRFHDLSRRSLSNSGSSAFLLLSASAIASLCVRLGMFARSTRPAMPSASRGGAGSFGGAVAFLVLRWCRCGRPMLSPWRFEPATYVSKGKSPLCLLVAVIKPRSPLNRKPNSRLSASQSR